MIKSLIARQDELLSDKIKLNHARAEFEADAKKCRQRDEDKIRELKAATMELKKGIKSMEDPSEAIGLSPTAAFGPSTMALVPAESSKSEMAKASKSKHNSASAVGKQPQD